MIRLLAVGDIALSDDYSSLIQNKGIHFPFTKIKSFLKKGNIVFGNLEAPLSDRGQPQKSKPICLSGSPEGINALAAAGITHVSLANNHAYDYGAVALQDTKQRLAQAGIATVGVGYDLVDSRKPIIEKAQNGFLAIMAYNAYSTNGRYYARRNRQGVAPLEYRYIKEDIRSLKRHFEPLIIVVSLHWGIEGNHYPTPFQRYLAHRIIEDGASLVIGHHPHVIQGLEQYRNGLIAYSLGNFCFPDVISKHLKGVGYSQQKENKESFIFDCEITQYGLGPYQIIPIYINKNLQPCIANGLMRSEFIKKLNYYSQPLNKINYEKFYKAKLKSKGSHLSRLITLFRREGVKGIYKRLRPCYLKAILFEVINYLRELKHKISSLRGGGRYLYR